MTPVPSQPIDAIGQIVLPAAMEELAARGFLPRSVHRCHDCRRSVRFFRLPSGKLMPFSFLDLHAPGEPPRRRYFLHRECIGWLNLRRD